MAPVADFTLHDLLKGDRLPRRSRALKQSLGCLASALNAVHQENIRHLDIKPANILVLDSGVGNYQVLLTDFGISLDGSNPAAALYGPRGMTPLYAAPEVHTGGERLSPASDVFSLGLVFLEVVTILAGRTVADLHSFLFLDTQDTSSYTPKAYSRSLDRVRSILSLYCQMIEQQISSSPETLSLDQLEMLMSMLQLSPSSRPKAYDIMRQFPQDVCCEQRFAPSFSKRCTSFKSFELNAYGVDYTIFSKRSITLQRQMDAACVNRS